MNTFGEISWESSFDGDKKTNNKDIWMRLEDGDNEIRLLTLPYQYTVHKYKKEGDKGYGQKVYCSKIHGTCPLCDAGDKPKSRWLFGVIDRKKGAYKILDVSYAVLSDIRKLNKNAQRWGDPLKYDLNIVVDRNGGPTGYYSVQPLPKEPLTAADQKIKDEVDFDDLKRRVTPPTPDQVQKRLDKLNGVESSVTTMIATTPMIATPVASKVSSAPSTMNHDEDDMDDLFPAHQE